MLIIRFRRAVKLGIWHDSDCTDGDMYNSMQIQSWRAMPAPPAVAKAAHEAAAGRVRPMLAIQPRPRPGIRTQPVPPPATQPAAAAQPRPVDAQSQPTPPPAQPAGGVRAQDTPQQPVLRAYGVLENKILEYHRMAALVKELGPNCSPYIVATQAKTLEGLLSETQFGLQHVHDGLIKQAAKYWVQTNRHAAELLSALQNGTFENADDLTRLCTDGGVEQLIHSARDNITRWKAYAHSTGQRFAPKSCKTYVDYLKHMNDAAPPTDGASTSGASASAAPQETNTLQPPCDDGALFDVGTPLSSLDDGGIDDGADDSAPSPPPAADPPRAAAGVRRPAYDAPMSDDPPIQPRGGVCACACTCESGRHGSDADVLRCKATRLNLMGVSVDANSMILQIHRKTVGMYLHEGGIHRRADVPDTFLNLSLDQLVGWLRKAQQVIGGALTMIEILSKARTRGLTPADVTLMASTPDSGYDAALSPGIPPMLPRVGSGITVAAVRRYIGQLATAGASRPEVMLLLDIARTTLNCTAPSANFTEKFGRKMRVDFRDDIIRCQRFARILGPRYTGKCVKTRLWRGVLPREWLDKYDAYIANPAGATVADGDRGESSSAQVRVFCDGAPSETDAAQTDPAAASHDADKNDDAHTDDDAPDADDRESRAIARKRARKRVRRLMNSPTPQPSSDDVFDTACELSDSDTDYGTFTGDEDDEFEPAPKRARC